MLTLFLYGACLLRGLYRLQPCQPPMRRLSCLPKHSASRPICLTYQLSSECAGLDTGDWPSCLLTFSTVKFLFQRRDLFEL